MVKLARLRGRGDRRLAMILGSQQGAIRAGGVFVLSLHGRWRDVMLVLRGAFGGGRLGCDSAGSAVIANVIVHGNVVDDGAIDVRVVNHGGIYAHHGDVIGKYS